MRDGKIKIGIVAPGSRIDAGSAEKVAALAGALYAQAPPELYFHPQCFLSSGHFAGDDETRAQALLEVANDRSVHALWFARGGYGSGRLAERVLAGLTAAAGEKTYLGYSDAGFLLAGLYKAGVGEVLHGPMPSDIA